MVLVGCLLLFVLLGVIGIFSVLPALLVGVGIIFLALGFVRLGHHDPVGRMYVMYGVVALGIGAIWFGWAIQLIVAQYALALLLILFGAIFLLYSTGTDISLLGRRQTTTTQTTTTTTQNQKTEPQQYRTTTIQNEQRVCRNCGAKLGPQMRFCDKCGATN
jgi:apolipoprotein N-acyltransferase